MATSKGVIQGYTGVAAVDAKHQIIVDAQAPGTGSEQELLVPVVKAIQGALNNEQTLITPTSLITADAGYHSESNLKQLADLNVDALSPTTACGNAIHVSMIRANTSKPPIRCTTSPATKKRRGKPLFIVPQTSTTTHPPTPAFARRANFFTATAATA